MGRAKFFAELQLEVIPVQELSVSFIVFFPFKDTGSPFGCSLRFHIQKCPDDFGLIIGEGVWAEEHIGLA